MCDDAIKDTEMGDVDVNKLFTLFQAFTANYLSSFDDIQPNYAPSGVRIMDVHSVVNGDKVHKACCSWNVAQDIIHAKQTEALRKRHVDGVNSTESGIDSDENRKDSMLPILHPSSFFEAMEYHEMIKEHARRLVLDHRRSSICIKVVQ